MMFDKLQSFIIRETEKSDYLRSQFYFTGGTALSVHYLQHRHSDDLDFFSERSFNRQAIIQFINECKKKHQFSVTLREPEGVNIMVFDLDFGKEGTLKIDFNHYPYERIEKGKTVNGIKIDSLRDIAGNKLLTINQRSDVKDFVDMYFLLKDHYTIWDLLYVVEVKFGIKLDMVMIAADFLKVEEFDFLPRMIKSLSNKELTAFFRKQARQIGKQIVE